jgi:hypothetical protein
MHPRVVPELEDVVVRRNGMPLPCEQLLPRSEVVAIVGESYHLTHAADPRPGVSICEWKPTTDAYEMSLRVHSEPDFADSKVSGPSGFFAFETSMPVCSRHPPELVANLGEQARICSGADRFHTVIVRRAKDVLVFSCPDCSRDDAIALAKAAAR